MEHAAKQLIDVMVEFLDREATVEALGENCYSDEFSDDYDFIASDEDIESESQYNLLIEDINNHIDGITDPALPCSERHERRARVKALERKEKEEKKKKKKMAAKKKSMNTLVDEASAKWHAEKNPSDDETSLGDEENERKPAQNKAKNEKKRKQPITPEIVESESDEDGGEGEEIPEEVFDSVNEPEVQYGTDSEDNDDDDAKDAAQQSGSDADEDILNLQAKLKGKCGICDKTLTGGYGEAQDQPWVRCPDKDNCKTTWMDYTDTLQFHKVVPQLLSPTFRAPSHHGRPRCDCNAIMAYHWIRKCSKEREAYLEGTIWLVCCVPVKEGGKCTKVVFAGKGSKEEKAEMEKIYQEELAEKVKKNKESNQSLKMLQREINRDAKFGTGVYNTTLLKAQKSKKAIRERLEAKKNMLAKKKNKTPNPPPSKAKKQKRE